MTDETMKDLVTKHDLTITQLVTSVEHLVSSQTVTNKRLEEISKYLAKQVVFGTKLDSMDKDLTDSFNRVHKRMDEMDRIQKSEQGCNSVRLLKKDVDNLVHLPKVVEELQLSDATRVSSTTIRWAIGLGLLWSLTFAGYIVTQLNLIQNNQAAFAKVIERNDVEISRMLHTRK